MGNIKQADKLLTYEIQALTAYQQVINKCQNKHELLTLIYDDHYDAVFTLQRMIQEKFNHPNKDTAFTSEFKFQKEENPNLNDKQTIIKALLEIEKNGAESYVEVLRHQDSHPDLLSLIELKFLPIQQAHVRSLDRLLLAESL